MKIALLTDGIHPYVIGGMQKHSYYLARELAKNGHTIYLFHCNSSSYDASKLDFFNADEREHIKSYLIPFPKKQSFPLHYISESYTYSKLIYDALGPVLPDIDFIFAQGFCAWNLLEHKKIKSLPPIVIHFHGFEMFQKIPSLKARISSYFLRRAVKKNLSMTDYAISYGGKITTILSKLVDKSKIWEIPAGIEESWIANNINPTSSMVRFVFVGRYERRKGLPELTAAIKKLIPSSLEFSFDFIGDIPEEKKIKHPSVKYHGKLSSEKEIKNILSGCDILVCPSYAEGMPNVIMEAMACGLAIIATNVGAVSLLVGPDNGWLIESPVIKNISITLSWVLHESDIPQKKLGSLKKIKNNFLVEALIGNLILRMKNTKKVNFTR